MNKIYRRCKVIKCQMPLLDNEDDICDICKSGIRYVIKEGDEETI